MVQARCLHLMVNIAAHMDYQVVKNVMLSKREANSQNIPSFASYIKADIPTYLDDDLFAHISHKVTAPIPGHFLSDT